MTMLVTIGRLPLPQFLVNYLNPVYQIFCLLILYRIVIS